MKTLLLQLRASIVALVIDAYHEGFIKGRDRYAGGHWRSHYPNSKTARALSELFPKGKYPDCAPQPTCRPHVNAHVKGCKCNVAKPVQIHIWRPISEAPKDGTWIIVRDPQGSLDEVYWNECRGFGWTNARGWSIEKACEWIHMPIRKPDSKCGFDCTTCSDCSCLHRS